MRQLDLVGQRIGRLTVTAPAKSLNGHSRFVCHCDCGNNAIVWSTHLRDNRRTNSCGCLAKGRDAAELKEFLLSRRVIVNDCWLWPLYKNRSGYGRTTFGGMKKNGTLRRGLVHRLAAHLWLGMDLNDKRYVCHKCDVPACFNPDHLFIGTASDNTLDSINKGRRPRGIMRTSIGVALKETVR